MLMNEIDNNPILQTPKNNNITTKEASNIIASESNIKSPIVNPHSENKSTNGKCICNCKKSKCLKLYCDCFAYGLGCGPECNCNDCANIEDNEERKVAIDSIIDRNPNAFKPKIE
jgi:protein lin-54